MLGTALCATRCYILRSAMEALVNSTVERVLGSVDISGLDEISSFLCIQHTVVVCALPLLLYRYAVTVENVNLQEP
jgi:hypothetical protein